MNNQPIQFAHKKLWEAGIYTQNDWGWDSTKVTTEDEFFLLTTSFAEDSGAYTNEDHCMFCLLMALYFADEDFENLSFAEHERKHIPV